MDKLEAMRVFTAVADCQSFVSASRELDLSAPALTRSIAQLEQSVLEGAWWYVQGLGQVLVLFRGRR